MAAPSSGNKSAIALFRPLAGDGHGLALGDERPADEALIIWIDSHGPPAAAFAAVFKRTLVINVESYAAGFARLFCRGVFVKLDAALAKRLNG
jgi:hypothetical protein